MRCTSCDHGNPEGARFCNACGAALEVRCASCDRPNPPGSRFCNACGAALEARAPDRATGSEAASRSEGGPEERLSDATDPRSYTPRHLAERILTDKAALEGERKHVTVLFADLADSTALAESVGDPEEVHALLDRAFRLMLAEIHGYEGTINQFTGDGVMALFGAPLALEDAPRRAIVAALAVQRALEPLDADVRKRHGRPFRMRIGIHSGPVVVASIGDDLRMDYTAIGDTTNLASRLLSLAEPGGVVISDATRRLVEGFFELDPLPATPVKGKSEPVRSWRVVSARPVSDRVDASADDDLTTWVGRERELDALRAAYDQACAGRGQVVFVVGEAGIGKSRLIHEFRRSLGDDPHVWMEGRCASYAQTTPFYAIADAIRRRYGIDERDDEAGALAKLDKGAMDGDLEWTLPYVRTLLSLPSGDPEVDSLDAMTRRAELCRALHARMLRASETAPQIIVIEDLHWIDTASEEFLGFVADSIPTARVLLVVSHRPGYQHPFGDRSYHVRIPLQALSEEAMASMVESVLEASDLPPSLRRLIVEKAEGNPLFVEEVTTSLLEEGVLALEQGRVRLRRELSEVSIPDRIQDVLMARLDRLPEEPKRAIQLASVIGREFALRLLSRIHDATEGLSEIVNELRSLELIYEKAAYPELAYMFKHALTHEVAYESVLVARRKALHRIVGTAIEELYADRIAEHYEALAHHFEMGDDLERALHYHELASEKSVARYANHAAIEHCREALAIADRLGDVDPRRLRALYERLAECCWMTSRFGPSGDAYRSAAGLCADPREQSLLLARASWSYLWEHDYETCRQTVERSLAVAEAADADEGRAFAMVCRDLSRLVHGQDLADDGEAERALAFAERSGDVPVIVGALSQLTERAEWRGDYRRAVDFGLRATALGEHHGSPGEALFAGWFLSLASICLGDYGRGFSILGEALTLCERIGDRAIKARLLNTIGWAHAEIGCHEVAMSFNRAGTDIAREAVELGLVAGAPELYANAAVNLAGNLTALGRFDEAEEQLAPIEEQRDCDPDPWMRWRWLVHLDHHRARLALARGEPDRALPIAEGELEGARRHGARKLVCRAEEQLGRIQLALGSVEEAEVRLRSALETARAIEHPPVSWRARGLLAEIARRRGDGSSAERELAAIVAHVKRLAPGVPDSDLRRRFLAFGEALAADPVGAYR